VCGLWVEVGTPSHSESATVIDVRCIAGLVDESSDFLELLFHCGLDLTIKGAGGGNLICPWRSRIIARFSDRSFVGVEKKLVFEP
jgi:hypothetical protein